MTYQEFERLGYLLKTNVVDASGIPHRLGVYPKDNAGGTNYFENLTDARAWMDDVKLIRAIQANDEEFLRRRKNLYYFKIDLEPT